MPNPRFSAELAAYGPQRRGAPRPSLAEAQAYCRRLARRHYENFTVASRLLPRRLRQHFANVYAYCRWADDLADETGDPRESLALVDWWQGLLEECCRGNAHHPVFVALEATIHQFSIPAEPFTDLLTAFRQDQRVTRYETWDDLLGYCRYSGNPVGRLVLYLGECHQAEHVELSDALCTGLQLANFWQDVAGDWDRGRVYLPQADCRQFGYDESMFARREANAAFRGLLAAEVDRAEAWLRRGLPLAARMPRRLRVDVALFGHGGLAILDAIRRQDYDVWSRRPVVRKFKQLRLLARCAWRAWRGRLGECQEP
ncbi:MAG: squalene synthase HpnC [Pirellulales bacterium]